MKIINLETERLLINKLAIKDTSFRFKLFNKKEDRDLFGSDSFENLQNATNAIQGFINLNNLGYQCHWSILRKRDSVLLGFFDAYMPAPHLACLKLCEISYGLDSQYRGMGYMSEIFSACLKFLIKNEGFHRIEANVNPTNASSIKLLENFGFQKEAVRKKLWKWDNEWHDMHLYALLENDYVGKLLKN